MKNYSVNKKHESPPKITVSEGFFSLSKNFPIQLSNSTVTSEEKTFSHVYLIKKKKTLIST